MQDDRERPKLSLFSKATVSFLELWSRCSNNLCGPWSLKITTGRFWRRHTKAKQNHCLWFLFHSFWQLNEDWEAEAHKSIHQGVSLKTILSWHTAVSAPNWLDRDKCTRKIEYFSCSLDSRTITTQACAKSYFEWMSRMFTFNSRQPLMAQDNCNGDTVII